MSASCLWIRLTRNTRRNCYCYTPFIYPWGLFIRFYCHFLGSSKFRASNTAVIAGFHLVVAINEFDSHVEKSSEETKADTRNLSAVARKHAAQDCDSSSFRSAFRNKRKSESAYCNPIPSISIHSAFIAEVFKIWTNTVRVFYTHLGSTSFADKEKKGPGTYTTVGCLPFNLVDESEQWGQDADDETERYIYKHGGQERHHPDVLRQ